MAMQHEEDWPEEEDSKNRKSDEDAGWYFDLPGGAWERQEEKNRDLRRRILENAESQNRETPPESEPQKRGLFGIGRKKPLDDSGRQTAGGTFRLARGESDTEDATDEVNDGGPEAPSAPPPLRIRRSDSATSGDYDEWSTEPSGAPAADSQDVGEPRSRWEEMFGAPAEGGGAIESMRRWASGDAPNVEPVQADLNPRWDGPPDAPAGGYPSEVMRSVAPGEPLPGPGEGTNWSTREEEPLTPVPPASEAPPASRWDEMFSAPAGGESMLEGMRRWASGDPAAQTSQNFEEGAFTTPAQAEGEALTGDEVAAGAPAFAQAQDSMLAFEPTPIGPLPWELEEEYPQESIAPAGDRGPLTSSSGHGGSGAETTLGEQAKKGGLLGRLFGRRSTARGSDGGAAEGVAAPGAAGVWVLPGDDDRGDIQIDAEIGDQPAAGWLAPDEPGVDWAAPDDESVPSAGWATSAAIEERTAPEYAWDAPVEAVSESEPVPGWAAPVEPEEPAVPGYALDAPVEAVSESEPVPGWAAPIEPAEPAAPEYAWDAPVEAVSESEPVPSWAAPVEPEELAAPEYAWDAPVEAVTEPEPVSGWAVPAEPREPSAPEYAWDAPVEAVSEPGPVSGWAASAEPEELAAPEYAWDAPVEAVSEPEPVSGWAVPIEPAEPAAPEYGWDAPVEAGETAVDEDAPNSPIPFPRQLSLDTYFPQETSAGSMAGDDTASDGALPAPGFDASAAPLASMPAAETSDADGWSPEPLEAMKDEGTWQASNQEPEPPAEPVVGDDPWAHFFSDRQPQPGHEPQAHAWTSGPREPEETWQPMVSADEGGELEAARDAENADPLLNSGEDTDDDSGWGDIVPPTGAHNDASQPAHESPLNSAGLGSNSAPVDARSPIDRGDVTRWLDSALDSETVVEPDPVDRWRESAPAQGAANPASYTPPPPLTAGDWQVGDEDDVVLRAFEAHANTDIDDDGSFDVFDQPSGPNTTFTDLLGSEGDDLVAEMTEPEVEVRPFSRLQGWAPQRTIADDHASAWPATGPGGIPDIDPAVADAADASLAPYPLESPGERAPTVRARHSRARTVVREAVETLLLAILVFLSVRASFQNFKVDGESMYPTLDDGQFLIVNKLVYAEVDMDRLSKFIPFLDPGSDPRRNVFHAPERGDIVVLKDPRDPSQDLIKRIIGLPGETVEIQDGKVYINDRYLEEPYIKNAWHDNKSKILIGKDEYFVMGDNRGNSLDSRSTQIGLVHSDLIIGKAMLSYWPTSNFGLAPNEAGKLASDISAADGRPVLTALLIGE